MHTNGRTMEDLKIAFLHKAFVGLQSKALLICFLVFLLLLLLPLPLPLTLPHLETLMPSWSHAILTGRGCFEGPAFAFLLLNCVVATLVASSKLESKQREHSEDRNRVKIMQMEDLRDEKEVGEISHNYESTKGESSSCSLSIAQCVDAFKEEPINHIVVNEERAIRRGRPSSRGNYQKPRLHANKPLMSRTLKDRKRDARGSSFSDNPEKPSVLDNHFDGRVIAGDKALGRAGIDPTSNHPPRRSHQNTAPATPALAASSSPSLEEVWAAIMSSNNSDDQQAKKQPHHSNVAASSQSATAAHAPPAAAAISQPAIAAPGRPAAAAFKAGPNPAAGAPPTARFATARSAHVEDVNREENDGEIEDLNRRAGDFIARFNGQMRLQRQESLQRQRGRRPCNSEIHSLHHLQLPARGLLVG